MHVVFPTTPAQYFHLLRRQIKRNFRKPLVVAGPKALLRLSVRLVVLAMPALAADCTRRQAAASGLQDMGPGTKFQPVLDDPYITDESSVQRVVFCAGKLYYDLVKERTARGGAMADRLAFVRIEELSPFPFAEVQEVLERYSGAKELFWVQEEPRNQGAYAHVAPRFGSVLQWMGRGGQLVYRGRQQDAVPAPGISRLYAAQQKAVLGGAFEGL